MVNDFAIFHDVAYSAKSGATFKLNADPNSPKPKIIDKTNNIVASWGTDNLRPQRLVKALNGLPQAKQVLQWQAKALYSGGLIYGTEDAAGNFTPIKDLAVDTFIRDSNVQRYLIESCVDYYWFGNPFSEIGLNGARKAAWIVNQDASFCRKGVPDEKTGISKKVYISADWEDNAAITEKDGVEMIDPYFNRVGQVKDGSAAKYFYSASFPSPGKIFYQELAWHDLTESGWLDVLKAIPAFKKALFKNQISVKYHIEIADWYWEFRYKGEWEKISGDASLRSSKIKETIEEIETSLTNVENAGKSIKSWLRTGADGKQESAIVIHQLDDKIKTGMYIEDSQEAFIHIAFSFGVDPTLIGMTPGKSIGSSGSGSDKRVAYNIYMLNCKADQDIILEPLHFIRDLNGWNPEIKFMFKNYYIATLDQGKEVTSSGSTNGGK